MKENYKINIAVDDIIFEVQNITHRTGMTVKAANNEQYESAAQIIASLDDSDKMQIYRSISSAASRIKVELEYLNEGPKEANNRILDEVLDQRQIEYNFMMPDNFDPAAVKSLSSGIHDYIVNSTIADWYMTTNPGAVKSYQEAMAIALENTKRALYKRLRPKRPKYYDDRETASNP